MTRDLVDIVIPSPQGCSTDACMDTVLALGRQTYHPLRVYIIPASSANRDSLASRLGGREWLEIASPPPGDPPGIGRLLNVGLRMGRAGRVCFLRPGALPGEDWLGRLLEHARRRPGCGVFCWHVCYSYTPSHLESAGLTLSLDGRVVRRHHREDRAVLPRRELEGGWEVLAAPLWASLWNRSLFERIGGVSEELRTYHYVSMELSLRARLQESARIVCLPDPVLPLRNDLPRPGLLAEREFLEGMDEALLAGACIPAGFRWRKMARARLCRLISLLCTALVRPGESGRLAGTARGMIGAGETKRRLKARWAAGCAPDRFERLWPFLLENEYACLDRPPGEE